MASEQVQHIEGIEVRATAQSRLALPPWFSEAFVMAQAWATTGLVAQIESTVRLPRGRMGKYESPDFVLALLVFAVSRAESLKHFFEHVAPARSSLSTLWNRGEWPKRSTLSRYLRVMNSPTCEALRTLFFLTSAPTGRKRWAGSSIGAAVPTFCSMATVHAKWYVNALSSKTVRIRSCNGAVGRS